MQMRRFLIHIICEQTISKKRTEKVTRWNYVLTGSTLHAICLFCYLLLWDLFCWHSIIPVLLVRNKRDRNVHHFNSWFPVICSCLPATTRVPGNSNLSQFLLSGLNCHAHCSLTAMTSIIKIHCFYYNYYYYFRYYFKHNYQLCL
jgi:hypothetical protein